MFSCILAFKAAIFPMGLEGCAFHSTSEARKSIGIGCQTCKHCQFSTPYGDLAGRDGREKQIGIMHTSG